MKLVQWIALIGGSPLLSGPAAAYCNPGDPGYQNCLYQEDLRAAGISLAPGVTSRPNPQGGFDYSNGVTCRRNPFGGLDCR